MKTYWTRRFTNHDDASFKHFDEIHFKNGYTKDSPFMRVEFLGFAKTKRIDYEPYYVLKLGKILEAKNVREK